jgi:hypothetical protein
MQGSSKNVGVGILSFVIHAVLFLYWSPSLNIKVSGKSSIHYEIVCSSWKNFKSLLEHEIHISSIQFLSKLLACNLNGYFSPMLKFDPSYGALHPTSKRLHCKSKHLVLKES